MHKYGRLFIGSGVVVLLLFGVMTGLGYSLDGYASTLQEKPSWFIGSIGCLLLVIDVFLPVPSSVIMLALGTHFGALWGTILGSIGGLGATLLAFALGRLSKSRVDDWLGEVETTRANRLLNRWGPVAMIISRPLPVLAESTAFVAGTTAMKWRTALWAGGCGALPVAILYSLAGAGIGQFNEFKVVLGVTFAVAAISWFFVRRIESTMS